MPTSIVEHHGYPTPNGYNPQSETFQSWRARNHSRAILLIAIFAIMILSAAFAAVSGRAFFADGAYATVWLLEHPHQFWITAEPRAFAYYIIEGPVLIGEKLGLSTAIGYSVALSTGIFMLPLAIYALAVYIVRKSFFSIIFVVLAAVFFIYSINYIVTEVNLLAAIVVLCAAVLSSFENSRRISAFILIAASLVSTRVYEGMIFSAPVLICWSYMKLDRAPTNEHKTALVISILGFAVAFLIALGSALAPRDPANEAGFINSFSAFAKGPHLYLGLCCISASIAAFCKKRSSFSISVLFSILLGGTFLYQIYALSGYYAYGIYYQNRAFVSLALAAFVLTWGLFSMQGATSFPRSASLAKWVLVLAVPVLSATASDSIGTVRWRSYVSSFCALLADNNNLPRSAATLEREGLRTGWGWTHPSLSVLLRRPGSSAVVTNYPTAPWEPQIMEQSGFPPWRQGLCKR